MSAEHNRAPVTAGDAAPGFSLPAIHRDGTHLAYGLPSRVANEQLFQEMASVKIDFPGELPHAMGLFEAGAALDQIHGYTPNDTDQRDSARHGAQMKGQFLLDRNGIVRWSNIECANDGLAGFGRFPTEDELLGALRVLP